MIPAAPHLRLIGADDEPFAPEVRAAIGSAIARVPSGFDIYIREQGRWFRPNGEPVPDYDLPGRLRRSLASGHQGVVEIDVLIIEGGLISEQLHFIRRGTP